jgi:hypothetical protein
VDHQTVDHMEAMSTNASLGRAPLRVTVPTV